MKNLTAVLLGIMIILSLNTDSFSQQTKVKSKLDFKKGPTKLTEEQVKQLISKNTKSLKKDGQGSWYVEEDFESGNFPPINWTVNFGLTEWSQAFVSGYGNGFYSMFYSSWNCNYSHNIIYTPTFQASVSGDKLVFDYAYAPWDDGTTTYYDDLEIWYYDDVQQAYYSLVFYNGMDLQTAPATPNYFEPQSNEWGTKTVDLPENTTQIYFQAWENCSNNLYIDNVRIGPFTQSTDAAVKDVWAKGRLARPFVTNDTIAAVIENTGTSEIQNLMVYLRVTGANTLIDSVEISSLMPSTSEIVKFKPFNPSVNGNSIVSVVLPYNDEDPGNDSLSVLCNVNSNYLSYADTTGNTSGGVGFFDAVYMLNKFRVSAPNTRITEIRTKVTDAIFDVRQVGQVIRGVVLDSTGKVVAKSEPLRLSQSDLNTFVSLKITDPIPYKVGAANSYFYGGVEYNDPIWEEIFWMAENQDEMVVRPNAIYYGFSQVTPVGGTVALYEGGERWLHQEFVTSSVNVDAGVSSLGILYDNYFNTTTFTPTGKVFNAGIGSATFTVNRRITPGAYSSTKTVTGLAAGGTANVTFDPFTFTSGTQYTVRDSIVMAGDLNLSNNVLSGRLTPRVAKQLAVLWQKREDRDSMVRAIIEDGRYANNFDTIDINYTGSYRPWRILFACPKSYRDFLPRVRDSLKSFVDGSTAGNKKSLIVFGDRLSQSYDPNGPEYTNNPADSVFLRQYLKSAYISQNWLDNITDSDRKFRGVGFFNGISQDSVGNPMFSTANLMRPVNGGSAAFVPKSVTGSGSDSAIAVSFAGTNVNTFHMTNRFSDLRASSGSMDGPVLVYTKIIDWLQSVSTGAKVLDLTLLIEGFYDPAADVMTGDTVKVNLRSAVNPFNRIDSAKGKLNTSGIGSFIFNNASNGVNYYIQIIHRNGLETWSKTPQVFSANHLTYNFTTAANKAFGDNMKLLGSKWAIFVGDVIRDGAVDLSDIVAVFNDAQLFVGGYVTTDLNGDEFVDLTDLTLAFNNSNAFVTAITPLTPPQILAKKGIVLDYTQHSGDVIPEMVDYIKIDHNIYDMFKNKTVESNNSVNMMRHKKGEGKRQESIKIR